MTNQPGLFIIMATATENERKYSTLGSLGKIYE